MHNILDADDLRNTADYVRHVSDMTYNTNNAEPANYTVSSAVSSMVGNCTTTARIEFNRR